jgi:hypothetical protein
MKTPVPIPSPAPAVQITTTSFDYVEGTLTVGKALLTVTADNKSKTYGEADPAFTFQYSGIPVR